MKQAQENAIEIVARNRKASHDYQLDDRIEAGIALRGTEIKSVRAKRVSLREAYVRIQDGEAWLLNAHIAAYEPASRMNHDPRRPRKLLLHRRQIDRLDARVRQAGATIVPTQMYLRRGRAKVEIAVARGKRKYDKRRALAEREASREMQRTLARKQKS